MQTRSRRSRKNEKKRILKLVLILTAIIISFFILKATTESAVFQSVMGSIPTNKSTAPIDVTKNDVIEKSKEDIHKGQLILINGGNPYQFKTDENLVSVFHSKNNFYKVNHLETTLNQSLLPNLNSLMKNYKEQTGDGNVTIISGYRDKVLQKQLYDNEVAAFGVDEASRWVAKPGTSEHHTGYALDFGIINHVGEAQNFDGTGQEKWLLDNCSLYGFILRYTPEKESITGVGYEPWHFRYVGTPHSQIITDNNFCFEEYMDYLKQFSRDNPLDTYGYQIYFLKATGNKTAIPVQKDKDYYISGNNVDGFIVTVEK